MAVVFKPGDKVRYTGPSLFDPRGKRQQVLEVTRVTPERVWVYHPIKVSAHLQPHERRKPERPIRHEHLELVKQ